MTIGEVVETIMGNHIYLFDGKVYRQKSGGPIGLELTGVVADIVMLWYDKRFFAEAERAGLKIHLHKRYVDDVNLVIEAVMDFAEGEPSQKEAELRLAEVLKRVADSIAPGMIVMEVDVPTNHANRRLPILDLEVWIEDNVILHSFYKKEVSTKSVIMARSALPAANKRAILISEGVRRLMNCSRDLSNDEKAAHLSDFNQAMAQCGHSESFRGVVTARAIGKYEKAWMNFQEEGKEVYRSKGERKAQIEARGGKQDKASWFRDLGYQNTLVIPATVDGALGNSVKVAMEKTDPPFGFKTMILEDGGKSIKGDLVRTNPFPDDVCSRKSCLVCSDGLSKGSCWKSNCVYEIECNRKPCNQENTLKYSYVGETSRTLKTRGSQHMVLYSGRKDNSFMSRHTEEEHDGVMGEDGGKTDYKMKVLNTFKDSLTRILEEAVRIQKQSEDPTIKSMNSKMEYFGSEYVRTVFMKGPTDQ